MALTATHVTDMAAKAAAVGKRVADLYYDVKQVVQENLDQGIAWTGDPPAYLTEALQANGNIDGAKYTPAQISTLFYALAQFVAYGDAGHLGSINVVQ